MPEAIGTWRERVTLTSTVKDGFRVGEVTVEFTESIPGSGAQPREERMARLKQLIIDGEEVAAAMNRQNELARTTSVTAK